MKTTKKNQGWASLESSARPPEDADFDFSPTAIERGADQYQLRMLTAKLYDAATPRRVRRALSFKVSALRAKLGNANALDAMIAASEEAENE